MPDLSGPFDTASFMQAEWYRDRGHVDPSGVFGTSQLLPGSGDLGLTAAGFAITLSLGRAHVRGAYYERTGAAWTDTVPANTSTVGPRIDRVVLRRDLAAKTVTPLRLQGTPAATPVPPPLTQIEDGVWDEPLHRITVPANSGTPLVITDERRYVGDRLRASAWSRNGLGIQAGTADLIWLALNPLTTVGQAAPVTYDANGAGWFTAQEDGKYRVRYSTFSDSSAQGDLSRIYVECAAAVKTRQHGLGVLPDQRVRGGGFAGAGGLWQYIDTELFLRAGEQFRMTVAHNNATAQVATYDAYVGVSVVD